jgi:HAD superfamily hydrolase (TIGR01509 family)
MDARAWILDVDGTIIDSNAAHVEAWQRAFARHGHGITAERIRVEIGKGGDKLVPSILGETAEEREGDTLRELQTEEFLAIARVRRLSPFPGARELVAELRRRGIRTAIATSSGNEHLEALGKSSGLDLQHLTDVLVNADDIQESKPAPDLIVAAVKKVGVPAAECVMVGDTPWDAQACVAAGVACIGVRSGGNDSATLRAAGAREVREDLADVLAHL